MPEANRRKLFWIVAAAWVLAAAGMLLAPSPSAWGAFGKKIGASLYSEIKPVLQPVAHVLLMATCAFLLMHLFSNRSLRFALLYSVGIAVGLAVVLEILQGLLPTEFARQCDPFDLVPSMAGAVLGGLAGSLIRPRTTC